MKQWPLALVGLLVIAGTATALTLGQDVVIEYGRTTITMGQNYTLATLTFSSAGAPILDGITLNLTSGSGYGNWTLTEFSQSRVTLVGNLTATGAIGVNGPANDYVISGIGPVAIQMGGHSPRTYPITSGAHTITITPATTFNQELGESLGQWVPTVVGLLMTAVVFGLLAAVLFARRG